MATLQQFSQGMLNLKRSAARTITGVNFKLEKRNKRLKIVSYAACCFEKSYFEKNAFEVLKCVIDMNK